jgi:hypothetical protein
MDVTTAPSKLRQDAARDLYAAMTEHDLPIRDAVSVVATAWYRKGIDLGWPEATARLAGRFVVEFAAEGITKTLAVVAA